MTAGQRSSSDLRAHPHLHVVFVDGAYCERGNMFEWCELRHLKTSEAEVFFSEHEMILKRQSYIRKLASTR